MKKPTDVIYVYNPKESPLYKWINLLEWAIKNNDEYLRQRVKNQIENLRYA